jgi:hypothetical protein
MFIRNGDPPGRFLKKDDRTGKWVDIGDKKVCSCPVLFCYVMCFTVGACMDVNIM